MGEKPKYYPPAGPEQRGPDTVEREPRPYIPPVGPGSKSVAPSGDHRDLPSGLVQEISKPRQRPSNK